MMIPITYTKAIRPMRKIKLLNGLEILVFPGECLLHGKFIMRLVVSTGPRFASSLITSRRITMIENYKDLWTKDFNLDAAKKYDRKWWSQCMDNLRHRQQVDLIKPFAKTSRTWLDFPVGSARLMRSIRKHPTQSWHGSDVSDAFLEMSQEILDRFSKQDLLHYKENNYELITCMHALFAFDQSDQEMILHNLAAQLDQ